MAITVTHPIVPLRCKIIVKIVHCIGRLQTPPHALIMTTMNNVKGTGRTLSIMALIVNTDRSPSMNIVITPQTTQPGLRTPLALVEPHIMNDALSERKQEYPLYQVNPRRQHRKQVVQSARLQFPALQTNFLTAESVRQRRYRPQPARMHTATLRGNVGLLSRRKPMLQAV